VWDFNGIKVSALFLTTKVTKKTFAHFVFFVSFFKIEEID